ncbi:MAG TPA: hypothetical protein VFU32_08345 [Ktedonobacterales bacterium]|nr:hypothetical protein [Ktedonobacterales bacterium]
MTPQFPRTWQGFFAQPAAPAFAVTPPSLAAPPPPPPPRPPVDHRPQPPEPPRRALELAWLTCQMPEHMREAVMFNLRQTLDWRAQHCQPFKPPKTPLATTRFGLLGEALQPKGAITLRKTLRKEARESVRVVEGTQPHLERNHLLAMRGARLGQLCAELEQRGLDALDVLRWELTALWN